MIFGLDYLGGAKYPDLVLREHPEGWAAGFFAVTFGNALPTVERLLASGRCPHVRIQLLWSDAHRFGDSDITQIKRLSRAYQGLKTRFPHVVVELSPFCEHNLSNPDKYLDIVQAAAPDCIPVNVPWRGALSRRYKNEVHGTHKKPTGKYNYSFDGLSCVDANVEAIKRQYCDAEVFYLWHPSFNGRLNTNDTTPRPQRKAWPTSELIDSVIYLHRDAGAVDLSSKHLWKSHADRHMTPPAPREYKPVFISSVDAKRIELVADNGQVVDILPRAGKFTDGRPMYRIHTYGYQLAEKARRIHGKPTVKLRANGKILGTVNPAFRAGSFR